MNSPDESSVRNSNPGYEVKDASIPGVLLGGAFTVAGIICSLLAAMWIYTARYGQVTSAGGRQTSFTEGPNSRSSISRDTEALRRETQTRLETYGWVDKNAGVVRIPVERAMDLMAEEAKR